MIPGFPEPENNPCKGKKTVKRWYYWFYKDAKQVQKVCKGCQNKADAWAFVCALPPINREVATIREIAKDMFLPGSNHVKRRAAFGRGVLESTLKESRTYLEKIIEKWGSFDIRDIKVSDVGNYLLGVDRSGSWKKHYITVFYEIYDEAAWQGLKVTLPIFPTFTRAQGKTDIFSSSELKRLFVPENFQGFAVDAETVYLLFLVSAFAGLRLGEARALRPKQFLLADKALVIDGFMRGDNVRTNFNKSGSESNRKFRIVLLPERVCGLVENYIQKKGIDAEQFLFTHENRPLRKEYLETIFELTKELWKIIILQSRPKEGKIGIVPFDLLWEKKTDLTDVYGGSEQTKTFFIEELVDDMKEDYDEDEDEINKPFELTEKKRIIDITTELPNVIHRPYGYYEYSEMDDSNTRFMKKQENTNTLKDDIFTQVNTEENNKKKKNGDDMKDLFESTEE
mgnify:CR=1 FL=1